MSPLFLLFAENIWIGRLKSLCVALAKCMRFIDTPYGVYKVFNFTLTTKLLASKWLNAVLTYSSNFLYTLARRDKNPDTAEGQSLFALSIKFSTLPLDEGRAYDP